MPDETFGQLISFSDVEILVLDHYKTWMHTWLCARERAIGIPVGSLTRPRSYITKQTFTALPGEEQTPLVITVSDGFAAAPTRRGSGRYDAVFRMGIAVMCSGSDGSARKLCGHYQTAIGGIALRHRNIGDMIVLDDIVDMRIEDVDEEVIGRSLTAVRLVLEYRVADFFSEYPALNLVEPPVDPEEPQPDLPEVEAVYATAENYKADEDIP